MGEKVRAVMAWRWIEVGGRRVLQSFIVRVPEERLLSELEWQRGNTRDDPGLPLPSIVAVDPVPDLGFSPRQLVVVHEEVWDALSGWLSGRGLSLSRIPAGEGDLPTFCVSLVGGSAEDGRHE